MESKTLKMLTVGILAALLGLELYKMWKSRRRENLTGRSADEIPEWERKYCAATDPVRQERLARKIRRFDPNWEPPC